MSDEEKETPLGCLFFLASIPLTFVLRCTTLYFVWQWFAWRVTSIPLPFAAAAAVLVVFGAVHRKGVSAADLMANKTQPRSQSRMQVVGNVLNPVAYLATAWILKTAMGWF